MQLFLPLLPNAHTDASNRLLQLLAYFHNMTRISTLLSWSEHKNHANS